MSVAVTPLLLLDKTWTAWSDVQNDKGHVLIIGSHSFCTKGEVTFTKENHFRDVFAVLRLMVDLFLEPHSVPDNQSLITDSLMLRLKSSSTKEKAGSISSNSFGKVNKKFFRYVIDMLSVQLVFDNWIHLQARMLLLSLSRKHPQTSFAISNTIRMSLSVFAYNLIH
jgi:hypothetical protein